MYYFSKNKRKQIIVSSLQRTSVPCIVTIYSEWNNDLFELKEYGENLTKVWQNFIQKGIPKKIARYIKKIYLERNESGQYRFVCKALFMISSDLIQKENVKQKLEISLFSAWVETTQDYKKFWENNSVQFLKKENCPQILEQFLDTKFLPENFPENMKTIAYQIKGNIRAFSMSSSVKKLFV